MTLWCSATCQLRKIEQLCSVDNCIFTASRFCFSEVGGVVFVGFFFWVVVGGGGGKKLYVAIVHIPLIVLSVLVLLHI